MTGVHPDSNSPESRGGTLWVPLALFFAALAVRLVAALSCGSLDAPHAALYEGDVSVWIDAMRARQAGVPFELDLPLRPPGTRWLFAQFVGDAESADGSYLPVRVAWLLLGALAAPLWWWAIRPCGALRAGAAGAAAALAGGAVQLALSPNSEVPYALGIALTVGLLLRGRVGREPLLAAALGVLQGLLCLLRAEHLGIVVVWCVWIAWSGRRRGGSDSAKPVGRPGWLAALALLLATLGTTLPYGLDAADRIERFQQRGPDPWQAPTLRWEPAAKTELERLPRFVQAPTARFVEVTLRHRGAPRVVAGDVQRLCVEAFGGTPRALPEFVFIALYGPLNFRLANGPENPAGGFTRAALDRAPPLEGGPERYAPQWLAQLPNADQLVLEYPPHLRMMLDGYGMGLDWILAEPGLWLESVAAKLDNAWSGIAHGVGGSALPFGPSGLRRRVDLTVPDGAGATAWRLAVLALSVAGLIRARRPGRRSRDERSAAPALLWALFVAALSAAFFGYARLGALIVPVAGLVLAGVLPERVAACCAQRWLLRLPVGVWLLVGAVVADGLGWWALGGEVLLDDQRVGALGAFERDVEVGFR